jgi:uncharacterized membrane protein YagU involved in acid resistance
MPLTTGSKQLSMQKNPIVVIAIAGLTAGTLDGLGAILWAYLKSSTPPAVVFKYIASGYYGKEAFAGGMAMVMMGILFHYLIASFWSALLYLLYPQLVTFIRNKFLMGLLYGIAIWLVMSMVIVPNSNVPPRKDFEFEQVAINLSILIVAVGIPISMVMARCRR